MDLTTKQQATLLVRAAESRRLAKRYLRDHGGGARAADLDAALAASQSNPEAVAAAAEIERLARAAAAQAKADADRAGAIRIAQTIEAAALGRWARAIELWRADNEIAGDQWQACGETEAQVAAVDALGGSPTWDDIAACVDESLIEWSDFESIYESIGQAVVDAEWRATFRAAEAAVLARVVPHGPCAVFEIYRKHGSVQNRWWFAKRGDAELLYDLWFSPQDATSSFKFELYDSEVAHG